MNTRGRKVLKKGYKRWLEEPNPKNVPPPLHPYRPVEHDFGTADDVNLNDEIQSNEEEANYEEIHELSDLNLEQNTL